MTIFTRPSSRRVRRHERRRNCRGRHGLAWPPMVGPTGQRDSTHRGRHTAGQRFVLVVNCIVVIACLVGAVALLVGKSAAEQSKRVALPAVSEPPSTTGSRTYATSVTMPTGQT